MLTKEEIDNWNYNYYDIFGEKKMLTKGKDRLVENTLGLVGEAGEVAEKTKKLIRDKTRFSDEEILQELGDVLFYVTALSHIYNSNINEVMQLNVSKLDGREARGTLKGSGDKR